MKKKTMLFLLLMSVILFYCSSLNAGDLFSLNNNKKVINLSGGLFIPTANEDWWNSFVTRTNFEKGDFTGLSFGTDLTVYNPEMSDAIIIGCRYTNYYKSSEYTSQYKLSENIPDSINIDIDVEHLIFNADIVLYHKFISLKEIDIFAGLGGGLTWWKIGIAEHFHDNDYDVSEYSYGLDTSLSPHLSFNIKMYLFERFNICVSKTFLRSKEHLWDTELSLDGLSFMFGVDLFTSL